MSNMILTSMDKLKIKEFINLLGHEQVTNFNFIDLVCSYMKEYVVLPRCDYCSCRENCDITDCEIGVSNGCKGKKTDFHNDFVKEVCSNTVK